MPSTVKLTIAKLDDIKSVYFLEPLALTGKLDTLVSIVICTVNLEC